jgi:mono/diheme cytochrome c family protein
MTKARRLVLAIGVGLVGVACAKRTPPPAATAPVASADTAVGHQLFDQHCAKCHHAGGEARTGKGRPKGPDLSKVGADVAHTPEWIGEHIRNPQGHKPDSKMPAFESKLQPDEVKAIAAYLAALKG